MRNQWMLVWVGGGLLCGARADEKLVLSRVFVDQVKNTAAIDLDRQFAVDAHLKTPHRVKSGGDDGDIHMAGRSDNIQLPTVAEIVNARLEKPAVTDLNGTSASQKVSMSGVWRIWFEHLGTEDMIQGDQVEVPSDSNPAHVFEIHPITDFDGSDVSRSSFVPIAGYTAYPASKAFPYYEKQQATIERNATAISITSTKSQYNYAEFIMELAGNVVCTDASGQQVSGSGSSSCAGDPKTRSLFVLANIFDSEEQEEPLTEQVRRMVFVNGTGPADQVAKLSKGDRLHVLGIPRVNLAEVSAMADGETMSGMLPYEMIIVAVLPEE